MRSVSFTRSCPLGIAHIHLFSNTCYSRRTCECFVYCCSYFSTCECPALDSPAARSFASSHCDSDQRLTAKLDIEAVLSAARLQGCVKICELCCECFVCCRNCLMQLLQQSVHSFCFIPSCLVTVTVRVCYTLNILSLLILITCSIHNTHAHTHYKKTITRIFLPLNLINHIRKQETALQKT